MKKELKEDLEKLMAYIPDPFTMGVDFKNGWMEEAKEMREAIGSGVEITLDWCFRDLTVRIKDFRDKKGYYLAVDFFSGAYNFRAFAQSIVYVRSQETPSKEDLDYLDKIFNDFLK